MATVSSDLDLIQGRLHDSGALWPRAELLRWYLDGYRDWLSKSHSVSRFTILDVPGRVSYARAFEWEARHTEGGTSWKYSLTIYDGAYQAMYPWESQHLHGVTPGADVEAFTQPWERAYADDGDRPFQFALPRNHERIRGVWWNHRRLYPTTVRELDDSEAQWMRLAGEPQRWTDGVGRNRMFEIFTIRTEDAQQYQLIFSSRGTPRVFSGERTWTMPDEATNGWAYTQPADTTANLNDPPWVGMGYRMTAQILSGSVIAGYQYDWENAEVLGESPPTEDAAMIGSYRWETFFGGADFSFGHGTVRKVISEERQYWPQEQTNRNTPLGTAVDWRSSDQALLVWEVIGPTIPALTEDDTPTMMPPQMQKYLRYFTLSRAFGRSGPGHNPNLAVHYEQRYARGVLIMQRLADVAHKDRQWMREPVAISHRRPQFVQFPSNFERVH